MADPRWISEADVVANIDLLRSIDAVRDVLRMEHAGTARTLEKTAVSWGSGESLHALGGVSEALGLVGTKTWAHTPGGATPLLVLWDAETGALHAVVEAFALGQLRTAAVSAVATAALAVPSAETMAMIGTGKQALAQVAAVVAVRPVREVRVFSPTQQHRRDFCARLRATCPATVVECVDVASAVAGAAVVTCATRARTPFLADADLSGDAHVNALGAITPERAELLPDVVERADVVCADSPHAAHRLSRELDCAHEIVALSSRVDLPRHGGRTVFKAMGLGLADVAVAAAVLRSGCGRPFAAPGRAEPRLFASQLEVSHG